MGLEHLLKRFDIIDIMTIIILYLGTTMREEAYEYILLVERLVLDNEVSPSHKPLSLFISHLFEHDSAGIFCIVRNICTQG